ncbi:ABC-F family ATP-binding cassette domain-containing protein [Radiobacillus sp. PE A8.2]|uniref:ABC-F family ATP-binding cassette domain-containing protein n=1 Tax=Radiobacillus sp. PE A8.2 TaxID=3380349 RepID=UPI00388D3FAE
MSILSVENLHKSYGDKILFNDISFVIRKNERIGLIGVNGTGKSSLLKIIAGIETKDAGAMKHANDFRVEYLPQDPELDQNLSVLDQIYYGESTLMIVLRAYQNALFQLENDPDNTKLQDKLMSLQQKMDQENAWDANAKAKTILTKLGITDFDQQTATLSGGQKKRVALAKALIQPADVLILDEPTNHLDNQTIEWLEGYLPQYQGSVVLVTHDRYFLNRITNRIYELDKGMLYTYDGNYEAFLEKKAEREEQELHAEQKHKNTLRRELEWLRRGAKARTTKQKARIQRAEDLQEVNYDNNKANVEFEIGSTRLGKKVIEIENISKAYQSATFLQDFNLLIVPGDRIGIIGPNGSGKSTLLNIITGRVAPDTGTVEIGPTVKLGYYTQDHSEMDENLRVVEYIREVAEVIYTKDGESITAEQMLERFLFPRSQQWTYIRKLSGGERRRLYLLRVLMDAPNVLLLDEPTNDLDTQTLSVLEDYLDHFPGVVITVSHDRYFLDRVVDRLIAVEVGQEPQIYRGNYSDYLELIASKQPKIVEKQEQPRQRNKKRKLSYRDQQDWNSIEDRIAELEEQIEQIKAKIEAAGSDLGKVQDLYKEQQQFEEQLEQAMDRWTELSILVEEIEQED